MKLGMDMLEVKIHDVLHDETDSVPNNIESKIEKWIESPTKSYEVHDVRVAWGDTNSPIFINLKDASTELSEIQRIARDALRYFSRHVDGVDIEKRSRIDNITISEPR